MGEGRRVGLRRIGGCATVAALALVPGIATASAPRDGARVVAVTAIGTGHVKRGVVLVDGRGRTLYLFTRDHGGSACYGRCASVWPPLLAKGRVIAKHGSAVQSRLLGTTRRKDGALQVTYSHHPLYLYSRDKRAGAVHGQGVKQFGGIRYLVGPGGGSLKPKTGGGGGCTGCPGGY